MNTISASDGAGELTDGNLTSSRSLTVKPAALVMNGRRPCSSFKNMAEPRSVPSTGSRTSLAAAWPPSARATRWRSSSPPCRARPTACWGWPTRSRPEPDERELDVIASTGEQVTVGLLALAIQAEGGKARSLLGHQVKVVTDSAFARARIKAVDVHALTDAFDAGQIAVVAGFQGVDEARQHHHAGPGRLGHLGGGGGRGAEGRRLRDLHRRRRRLHRRPQRRRPAPARSPASATRRCWSWRRWGPRCCRSARSSSG